MQTLWRPRSICTKTFKQNHPNIYDNEVTKMKIANIMEKYFV